MMMVGSGVVRNKNLSNSLTRQMGTGQSGQKTISICIMGSVVARISEKEAYFSIVLAYFIYCLSIMNWKALGMCNFEVVWYALNN